MYSQFSMVRELDWRQSRMKKTDHEVTAKMHYIGWEISYKTLTYFYFTFWLYI